MRQDGGPPLRAGLPLDEVAKALEDSTFFLAWGSLPFLGMATFFTPASVEGCGTRSPIAIRQNSRQETEPVTCSQSAS